MRAVVVAVLRWVLDLELGGCLRGGLGVDVEGEAIPGGGGDQAGGFSGGCVDRAKLVSHVGVDEVMFDGFLDGEEEVAVGIEEGFGELPERSDVVCFAVVEADGRKAHPQILRHVQAVGGFFHQDGPLVT